MTPKEKAQELRDKYQSCEINFLEYAWVCPKGAKELALIAVDEIIKSNPTDSYSDAFIGTKSYDNSSYWEQVKQEIEKL